MAARRPPGCRRTVPRHCSRGSRRGPRKQKDRNDRMPSFDVTVEGKTYHVEVPDPGACPLRVIVDGQPFAVAMEGGDARAQSEQLAAPQMAFAPQVASALSAAQTPPPLPRPSPAYTSRPPAPPAKDGHWEVRAPMPGTILSVNVSCLLYTSDAADDLLCVDLGG